jgi:hypothetical protein
MQQAGMVGVHPHVVRPGCALVCRPLARLAASTRLLAHCLRRGLRNELRELVRYQHSGRRPPTVVEGDRAFVAYPFFRDPARSIPARTPPGKVSRCCCARSGCRV